MSQKILILASNPRKDLNLNREIYFLQNIIERSRNHSHFDVAIGTAVRPKDLHKLFRDHQPRIVHFCGHGTGKQGLVLEDDNGQEQLVSTVALSNLFKVFSNIVECVLLNACYSEEQATAIVEHINYVIGMKQTIQDNAATYFTRGFYKALGDGDSIERCYESGRNEIELESSNISTARKAIPVNLNQVALSEDFLPEHLKPVLKIKPNLTAFPQQKTYHNESGYQQYQNDFQNNFHLGERVNAGSQPSEKERLQRQSLLNNVKSSWIEGFLEKSLQNRTLLKLDLEGRPDAVKRPSSGLEELSIESEQSFEWLRTSDIFNQMGTGRTLLILGEPGAGKTIELLKLAQRLIERTEQDLSRPIPVVFNLSSWTNKHQNIEEWLIEELKEKYRVPPEQGENWIKNEQILLLLDGLDEVQPEYRNDCVKALNLFLDNHSITEMVVCSRVQDYEKLSERLKLRNAIYIRPITSKYIDWYLEDIGASLAGLKTVLKQDKELEEFAKTPLILSVMSWAYRGYSAEEVLRQLGSAQERRYRLFTTYIERMLDRRKSTQQYSRDQTKQWLSHLAQRMVEGSQAIFLIEKIQPTWLQGRNEERAYRIRSFLVSAPGFGLLGGLPLGLLAVLMSHSLLGLLAAPIFALMFGLIFGIFTEREVLTGSSKDISLFERFGWSWQRAKSRFSLISAWSVAAGGVSWSESNRWEFVLIGGLIGGAMGVLYGGFGGSEVEQRTVPNQGIRTSWKNAAIIGASVGLTVLIVISIMGLNHGLSQMRLSHEIDQSVDELIKQWGDGTSYESYESGNNANNQLITNLINDLGIGLIFGLSVGLIAGLKYGGTTCIQHFTLRWMLYQKARTPWNYAKFLDFASERLLMKKVGGGYVFYHRMLMEHFANKSSD